MYWSDIDSLHEEFMNTPTPSSVLFVDQTAQLGGGELSLLDLAKGWRGQRRVVLFEGGVFEEKLRAEGVDVVVVHAQGIHGYRRSDALWMQLKTAPAVAKLIRAVAAQARRFDVVYANSQKAFVIGAIAARIAGRPCIWHLRDMLTADHFSKSTRRMAVFLANQLASGVIANSRATADAFVDAGGNPDKVKVVYNGFDISRFATDRSGEVASFKEKFSIGNGPVVSVFGRLARWKGQHVAIRALANVPNAQLLLVGAALFDEADYERELRSLVAELGLETRVRFCGFIDDVPLALAASDCVLHTSVAPEPFGRVIVEAMLAGKPVVASAAGGVRELVEDQVNGLLFPPGESDALAVAVQSLVKDPVMHSRIASTAKIWAQQHFPTTTMIENVERTLQGFLNNLRGH